MKWGEEAVQTLGEHILALLRTDPSALFGYLVAAIALSYFGWHLLVAIAAGRLRLW